MQVPEPRPPGRAPGARAHAIGGHGAGASADLPMFIWGEKGEDPGLAAEGEMLTRMGRRAPAPDILTSWQDEGLRCQAEFEPEAGMVRGERSAASAAAGWGA